MAKINLPKGVPPSSSPAGDTRSSDLEFAKLDSNLAMARVRVVGEVLTTIGKGFDYLRSKEDSKAVIIKAHAEVAQAKIDLEKVRENNVLGHRELDKLEEAQTTGVRLLNLLIDEAGQIDDFEQRRRVVADATDSLKAIASLRKSK